jgi:hypothetical protein
MMMLILAVACLQDSGIASQYPGDEGIEKDPRVLFVEDFEPARWRRPRRGGAATGSWEPGT